MNRVAACAAARRMGGVVVEIRVRADLDSAHRHWQPVVGCHRRTHRRTRRGDVRHRAGRQRGHIARCRERNYRAVVRPNGIRGVCTHIVGGMRGKISCRGAEGTRTLSGGVREIPVEITGRAHLETARCHRDHIVGCHVAVERRAHQRDVRHRASRKGRGITCRGERKRLAVARAHRIGRIRTHIVRRVRCKSCQVNRIAACAAARSMRGVVIEIRTCADLDSASRHRRTAIRSHIPDNGGRGGRHIFNPAGNGHRRHPCARC